MKKLLLSSVVAGICACGGATEEPVQIITINNNETPNNATPNNATPNNVTPNNVTPEPAGLALLGDGAHTLDAVEFTVIAGASAALRTPRDLSFHPTRPTELWVLNLEDNTTVVFDNPNTPQQAYTRYSNSAKDHFMASPSALAFGDNGLFATAQETDLPTQGNATPADFMGPTLWTSDRSVYDGGHMGHMDMLHNSPNGAGIAWETGNAYWVFDGYHESVTRYDFGSDHGPGGADHSDGDVARYVEGEVSYMSRVPSHMVFDQGEQMLYLADSGNNRLAVLDPSVGTMGGRIQPNYDGGAQYQWTGGSIETWVNGADVMLEVPSGLEFQDGMAFVSDNKLSRIVAIDRETKELVDYLDLGDEVPTGGLMGMAFADDGSLYLVDAVNSQILRVAPRDAGGEQ